LVRDERQNIEDHREVDTILHEAAQKKAHPPRVLASIDASVGATRTSTYNPD
jgi:hypothetical protein